DRRLELPLAGLQQSEVVQDIGVLGIESPGGFESGDRLGRLPRSLEEDREAVRSLDQAAVEADRLAKGRLGALRLARVEAGEAEVREAGRPSRRLRRHLVELVDRLRMLELLHQGDAVIVGADRLLRGIPLTMIVGAGA